MTFFILNCLFKGPVSKYSNIGVTASTHKFIGGHNWVHNSVCNLKIVLIPIYWECLLYGKINQWYERGGWFSLKCEIGLAQADFQSNALWGQGGWIAMRKVFFFKKTTSCNCNSQLKEKLTLLTCQQDKELALCKAARSVCHCHDLLENVNGLSTTGPFFAHLWSGSIGKQHLQKSHYILEFVISIEL